jgi:hypothetical protein
VAFVHLSDTGLSGARYAALLGYALAILGLYVWLASSADLRSIAMAAGLTAVLSVGVDQVFGFLLWPGLLKDLAPLSFEHMTRLAVMIPIAVGVHLCAALLAYALTRLRH